MVRYELILHRPPKLSVADIPKRMGDLPEEFSEGTLQRALENPDGGSIAIAWGDRRKRLHVIKRRIEILGGSAEVVDRAGPLAKKLTEIGDTLREYLPKKPEAPDKADFRDPSELSFVLIGLALAACAGGIVYARMTPDALHRTYSLRGAGFALSLIMSQLFVRGVRRWFSEEGRAWVSMLLVLLPMLTLFGAGYEAYTLGVVKRSAALIAGQGKAASAKPLMKPFAALIVELRHRKQRQELAAALAGENKHSDDDSAAAPAGEAAVAAEIHSAEQTEASAAPSKPARGRHAKPSSKRKAAMTSDQANPVDSPQLTAAAIQAPAETSEAAMARWVGDVGQATPTTLVVATPAHEASAPQQPVKKVVAVPAPAPSEPWDPLRRIDDVNEIHVAIAMSFAAMMFVVGMWSGRRRARKAALTAMVDTPAPAPAVNTDTDIAPEEPARAASDLPEAFVPSEHPLEADDPWADPPQLASSPTPVPPAPEAPALEEHAGFEEASFADLTAPGISPTDDPLALPDAFEGSVPPVPNRREPDTLPSLPPPSRAQAAKPAPSLDDANRWPEWPAAEPQPASVQPAAANDNAAARAAQAKEPKPAARKRAAGAARGGIQEEMVVRRRSDARRDD